MNTATIAKQRRLRWLGRFLESNFGGHFNIGPLTIFGFNAMHVAFNLKTKRWGWLCFHPTFRVFGMWWPWYFYVSPNGTPWAATFAIGPGVYDSDRARAILYRSRFGHNFNTEDRREEMESIQTAI